MNNYFYYQKPNKKGVELNKKPLIIGIDPGTTTAIAFLNAEGKPIKINSSRKYSKEKLIQEIREQGTPMIIGTDKSKLPSSLKNITSKFTCKVNTPKEDLSQKKKSKLTNNYNHLVNNQHEKDALASAIQAHKSYSKQLNKIKKRNKDKYQEIVREKLINTNKFKDAGKGSKKPTDTEKKPQNNKSKQELEKELDNLRSKAKKLKKRTQNKEKEIKKLKNKLSKIKETKGITEKEAYLQSKINRLKKDKKEIKEKLNKFTEAHEKQNIKKMTEKEARRKKFTENKQTFQKLKQKGKQTHLITILHEKDGKIYYKELDHCEPKRNLVKTVLKKYRKKRK